MDKIDLANALFGKNNFDERPELNTPVTSIKHGVALNNSSDGKVQVSIDNADVSTNEHGPSISIPTIGTVQKGQEVLISSETVNGISSLIVIGATGSGDIMSKAMDEANKSIAGATDAMNQAKAIAENAQQAVQDLQADVDEKLTNLPTPDNKTFHGHCLTSSTIAAKEVTVETGFKLTTGSVVIVDLEYGNTAVNPTLNVNNTGAIPIMTNGTRAAYCVAHTQALFFYDGSVWQNCGSQLYGETLTLGNPASSNAYLTKDAFALRYGQSQYASFNANGMAFPNYALSTVNGQTGVGVNGDFNETVMTVSPQNELITNNRIVSSKEQYSSRFQTPTMSLYFTLWVECADDFKYPIKIYHGTKPVGIKNLIELSVDSLMAFPIKFDMSYDVKSNGTYYDHGNYIFYTKINTWKLIDGKYSGGGSGFTASTSYMAPRPGNKWLTSIFNNKTQVEYVHEENGRTTVNYDALINDFTPVNSQNDYTISIDPWVIFGSNFLISNINATYAFDSDRSIGNLFLFIKTMSIKSTLQVDFTNMSFNQKVDNMETSFKRSFYGSQGVDKSYAYNIHREGTDDTYWNTHNYSYHEVGEVPNGINDYTSYITGGDSVFPSMSYYMAQKLTASAYDITTRQRYEMLHRNYGNKFFSKQDPDISKIFHLGAFVDQQNKSHVGMNILGRQFLYDVPPYTLLWFNKTGKRTDWLQSYECRTRYPLSYYHIIAVECYDYTDNAQASETSNDHIWELFAIGATTGWWEAMDQPNDVTRTPKMDGEVHCSSITGGGNLYSVSFKYTEYGFDPKSVSANIRKWDSWTTSKLNVQKIYGLL